MLLAVIRLSLGVIHLQLLVSDCLPEGSRSFRHN